MPSGHGRCDSNIFPAVTVSLPDVRSSPSILVIDDQPTVRRMAHRLLSEWGFRVFEAESGEEGMEVLETARSGVQLVIVDVVMPLSDGVQVTQRIRERWPTQRTLYMSAHPAEVLMQYGLTRLDAPFLAKPFTRDELLTKVSEALAAPTRVSAEEPPR
jgi:two-component system, cell cycle sensor histidine kinase and response regulator CckA